VSCRANGDPNCTYVMGPSEQIPQMIADYCAKNNLTQEQQKHIMLTNYLETKKKNKYEFPVSASKSSLLSRVMKTITNTSPGTTKILKNDVTSELDMDKKIFLQTSKLFQTLRCNPRTATVEFVEREKERYIFIRPKALSKEFLSQAPIFFGVSDENIAHIFASHFLYDLGRSIGRSDHYHIIKYFENLSPLSALTALQVNFANTGWGAMEILNCSNTSNNLYLRYVMHSSCEAESWENSSKSKEPVCLMNAGYVSAWLAASFGSEFVTLEISCRASGGLKC